MARARPFGSRLSRAARWPYLRAYGRAGHLSARWTSVRKVKEGETTNDLFGFLTTGPNAEVKALYPKAMPVILTTRVEAETWLTAPTRKRWPCKGVAR